MITVNRLIVTMETSTLVHAILMFIRGELTEAELIPIPDGPVQAQRLWEQFCGADHDRPQMNAPERGAKPYPRRFVQESLRAQYFELEGDMRVEVFVYEAAWGIAFGYVFLNFVHKGQAIRQLVSKNADYAWTDIPPDQFVSTMV
jgi:hypothetical protein